MSPWELPPGTLVVVPTPLGNLGDLTERARIALTQCTLIAAEDTRRTGQLLQTLGVRRPMISLHDHNETARVPEILERLGRGETVALATDAGMPLVSDPGYRLVEACIAKEFPVTVLPGPSAVITALAGSGMPPHPFYFGGFLPVKSGRREAEIRAAMDRGITHIYFESPHRLVKTLEALCSIDPEARVCVARELSKKFEEYRRGTAAEVSAHYRQHPPKGEITLLLRTSSNRSPAAEGSHQ
jgi:16S rRNA (cytidine1402-2'-O)-methyltransferase